MDKSLFRDRADLSFVILSGLSASASLAVSKNQRNEAAMPDYIFPWQHGHLKLTQSFFVVNIV